jgi:hypothetical protein
LAELERRHPVLAGLKLGDWAPGYSDTAVSLQQALQRGLSVEEQTPRFGAAEATSLLGVAADEKLDNSVSAVVGSNTLTVAVRQVTAAATLILLRNIEEWDLTRPAFKALVLWVCTHHNNRRNTDLLGLAAHVWVHGGLDTWPEASKWMQSMCATGALLSKMVRRVALTMRTCHPFSSTAPGWLRLRSATLPTRTVASTHTTNDI